MLVRCNQCEQETTFTSENWRCDCGGAWEIKKIPSFNEKKIIGGDFSIWRYGAFLGLDIHAPPKRTGVGWTPLVPVQLFNRRIFLKLEYLSPSGSFKDR